MSLLSALTHRATTEPNHVALDVEGASISYGEIDGTARRLVTALRRVGVGSGDRVAYLGRSSLEFYLLVLGAMRCGAVVVPLNWRCTAHELVPLVDDAHPSLLVVDTEYSDLVPELQGAGEHPMQVVQVGLGADGRLAGTTHWSDWLAVAEATDTVEPALSDTVLQMYTSGTSGRPKGVMASEESLGAYLEVMSAAAGLASDSVSLSALPHFHIGGTCWTLAGLRAGATVIVTRDPQPQGLLQIVRERGVTNLIAVPTLIKRLAEENARSESACDSIRTFYYGGSPITERVLKLAFAQFHCDFVQGYGLTECSLVAILEAGDHLEPRLLRSCGRPVAGSELRLVDPHTFTDVPGGDVGEIWVRSKLAMKGYWNQPNAMREAFHDGWFRTGDMASQDADGFIFLHDRLKDVIVTGGENVSSLEVENVLMSHPGIEDAAVIGLASDRWDETVTAAVVARDDALTESGIITFCRERLARYKCPTSVVFVESLPRNPAGKVLKGELRAQYAVRA